MGYPVFPVGDPGGVGTVLLLLWVPSRLEAGTEPGLGLSASGPAFSRPVVRSRPPAPGPPPPPGPPESGGTPAELAF